MYTLYFIKYKILHNLHKMTILHFTVGFGYIKISFKTCEIGSASFWLPAFSPPRSFPFADPAVDVFLFTAIFHLRFSIVIFLLSHLLSLLLISSLSKFTQFCYALHPFLILFLLPFPLLAILFSCSSLSRSSELYLVLLLLFFYPWSRYPAQVLHSSV